MTRPKAKKEEEETGRRPETDRGRENTTGARRSRERERREIGTAQTKEATEETKKKQGGKKTHARETTKTDTEAGIEMDATGTEKTNTRTGTRGRSTLIGRGGPLVEIEKWTIGNGVAHVPEAEKEANQAIPGGTIIGPAVKWHTWKN